jgi:hypothetical protein
MRECRWLAPLLVVAGVIVAPVHGQTKLEWKFKEKKPFYQEITTKTKQQMTISGQKIDQTQTQTFYFSWTPKEFNKKNKTWTIVQKIIGVKMDIQIGGNTISYDSVKDSGQNNPLGEFFKQLVDSEFTLTVNDKMKITKVEGKDKFVEKLTKANPQMEALLKEILSDEAIKQMADPTFGALPDKPVKDGEKWTRKNSLNMGPIGKYETDYTYTFQGKNKNDKYDRIKVETKLKYTPPDAKGQTQLPFKITKADLKSDKKGTTGTILFDTKEGRVVSSDLKLHLTGSLDIDIGGTTTKVTLDQTQTTTVKTTDKNPVAKKEKETT